MLPLLQWYGFENRGGTCDQLQCLPSFESLYLKNSKNKMLWEELLPNHNHIPGNIFTTDSAFQITGFKNNY